MLRENDKMRLNKHGRSVLRDGFFIIAAALAAWGCGPDGGGGSTGRCLETCQSTYEECLSCCNMLSGDMQQDCLTSCECDLTCCEEQECNSGQVGLCGQCRDTDPHMDCDPVMAADDDGDGFNEYENDCDDNDPSINPDAEEVATDGIDNDCNGITDADLDGDGFTTDMGDCDDDNWAINPAVSENCVDEIDNDCDGMTDTDDDECPTPCEQAAMDRSSVGCVYYAVDTNPMHASIPGDYAVAISNIDVNRVANVTIEAKDGGVWAPVANGQFAVDPLDLHSVVLPHRYIDGDAIYQGGAYRITSDLPVIAYQFNPLDGSQSYLSDASLLLPASALDTHYIVPHWPYGPADTSSNSGHPAHIQIAASVTTQVRVYSTIASQGGSIPAAQPGTWVNYDLQEGDFLQLTVANWMDSFNGTIIEADGPVAVYASNDCANVPADGQYCCCEHLEEQIFGLQTWGEVYVGARSPLRGSEPTVWHILAHQDGTNVSINAHNEISGYTPDFTLNAGEHVEFTVSGSQANPGDFLVIADKPVLVTQYMVGAFMVEQNGDNGDPAMVQMVPVEQYLDQYVVLVPNTWINDFLILIRPEGASIQVDGTEVTGPWVGVGATNYEGPYQYEVTRHPVSDGVHVLTGTDPFGVIVLGYDSYDSYAYPGGLDQQVINPVE